MIDYKFLEDSIKFKNTHYEKINFKIIGIIIGTDIPYENYFQTIINKNAWIIPNFDYKGFSCVKIYINDSYYYTLSLPNYLTQYNKHKSKIVGIGLNKTGTTSFAESLRKCGLKRSNQTRDSQYLTNDVLKGNIYSTISILEHPNYEVYQDMPFSMINTYKTLYEYRPQDYYVLTIRDNVEQWVDSAYNFFSEIWEHRKEEYDPKELSMFYNSINKEIIVRNHRISLLQNWGIDSKLNIKNKLTYVYNKHIDDVTNFFESKISSNFIIVNVSKENELKNLSKYIGFESVENDFVWVNKRKK